MQHKYELIIKYKVKVRILQDIIFLVIGAILLAGAYYFAGLFFIMISCFGYLTNKDQIVCFTDEQIIYPSVFKKKISWNETENVILKDGILTIDLLNNKLIQLAIHPDNRINEQEFNDYCKTRIGSAATENFSVE